MSVTRNIVDSKTLGALTVGILALSLGACETINAGSDAHPLTGKTWRLVNVETEGGATRLSGPQQQRHTLIFNTDGLLQIKLDCNNGRATWNASDPVNSNGTLNISQVASTRAFCPSPTWGEDLALDLSSSSTYTITQNRRGLVIQARRVTYTFEGN